MAGRGELTVIGVRAQALADELRSAWTLSWIARLGGNSPARCSPFFIDGPELSWAAQRLRSSCERALGTRGRHYDALGEADNDCHICHRPRDEPGELYCSAGHPLGRQTMTDRGEHERGA